jgi:hypothetical protein
MNNRDIVQEDKGCALSMRRLSQEEGRGRKQEQGAVLVVCAGGTAAGAGKYRAAAGAATGRQSVMRAACEVASRPWKEKTTRSPARGRGPGGGRRAGAARRWRRRGRGHRPRHVRCWPRYAARAAHDRHRVINKRLVELHRRMDCRGDEVTGRARERARERAQVRAVGECAAHAVPFHGAKKYPTAGHACRIFRPPPPPSPPVTHSRLCTPAPAARAPQTSACE